MRVEVCNPSHHSYFALGGCLEDCEVQFRYAQYDEVDQDLIPCATWPVDGSPSRGAGLRGNTHF